MHWTHGHKSKLTISNRLLMHKTVLKPFTNYGIQLWCTASTDNFSDDASMSTSTSGSLSEMSALHLLKFLPLAVEFVSFGTG
jgi:hypothetical protein